MINNDAHINHPKLPELLGKLPHNGVLEVRRRPKYPQGRCYWNVDDHVRANGGQIVFGWLVVESPGLLVYGWHHAVWESPSGELIDISSHMVTGEKDGTTLFVVDEKQEYDFAWPLGKPQVFQPLIEHPVVEAFCAVHGEIERLKLQAQTEVRRIPGARHCPNTATTDLSGTTDGGRQHFNAINAQFVPTVKLLEQRKTSLFVELSALQHAVMR